MTCVASHESPFELFDVAMLRLIPKPGIRQAKEPARGVPISPRGVISFVAEYAAIHEDDGERWDGLS